MGKRKTVLKAHHQKYSISRSYDTFKFYRRRGVLQGTFVVALYNTMEASITKLTFYHIRCFLLSKDAFTPNLAEFGPATRARSTNLALNQSRIEILRVRKKLQNMQKLMTF